jgi:drug/metabolite transporter (DMT)-like permease
MPLRAGTSPLAVAGALGIVYVVWGSTYTAIVYGLESMPPFLLSGSRFLAAGAILVVALKLTGSFGATTRRHWAAALLTGAPLLALGNGGVVWAQQRVPSGIAALLIASVPLWIAVLDRAVWGRRLSALSIAGLALGFAGIAILVDFGGSGGVDPVGAAVLVLAALGWATGTLLARGAALPPRPLQAASMQMLAGGTVLMIAATVTGELGEATTPSARSIAGWLYLVVFGSIVAFTAYGWLLRVAPTGLVATYAFVNPIVAVLLGWIMLGETIGGRELVAGGVIVAGVALIVRGTTRAGQPAPAPRRLSGDPELGLSPTR